MRIVLSTIFWTDLVNIISLVVFIRACKSYVQSLISLILNLKEVLVRNTFCLINFLWYIRPIWNNLIEFQKDWIIKKYGTKSEKVYKASNTVVLLTVAEKVEEELRLECRIKRFLEEFELSLLYEVDDIDDGIKE